MASPHRFDKEYFETINAHNKYSYSLKSTQGRFRAFALTIKNVFSPSRILDLGCAKGYMVKILNESGMEAYGVDISPYAVSSAPEYKERLFILDIQHERLPFGDNRFDFILSLDVFEHLEQFDFLLSELKRVITSNGRLLIATPNPRGRLAKTDPTHINVHPKRFWNKLLGEYGFSPSDKTSEGNKFRKEFLHNFSLSIAEVPPATATGEFLARSGYIGRLIRANILPRIDYFSFFSATQILLFQCHK